MAKSLSTRFGILATGSCELENIAFVLEKQELFKLFSYIELMRNRIYVKIYWFIF